MTDDRKTPRSAADAELERDIRRERKFTLAEAIGRLAGPGAVKGASPISRMRQAEIEVATWLRAHLVDVGGTLEIVLHRYVTGTDLLLNNFDQPLVVLAACCQQILESDYRLSELVREADVEWARTMGERPYFERGDGSCHPEDPFTLVSVRKALLDLLKLLGSESLASGNP